MNALVRAQKMADMQDRRIREAEAKQRRIEMNISTAVRSAMLLNEYFMMGAVYAAFAEPRIEP